MALNIKQLSADSESRVFALVAGKQGIGKTTQATTFPRKSTLIISLEKGLLSLKGSNFAAEEITTYDRLIEILTVEIAANTWIKHVCIDSLSEIYDLIGKEAKDMFTPAQNYAKNDYVKMKMMYAIRLAKQLDVDCFFTCHTKEVKDGLVTSHELAFDGKMPEDIKKQFDLILHLTTTEGNDGEDKRIFITSPIHSKMAKRRVSPFLNIKINDIEEPNLYKLTQKLSGK